MNKKMHEENKQRAYEYEVAKYLDFLDKIKIKMTVDGIYHFMSHDCRLVCVVMDGEIINYAAQLIDDLKQILRINVLRKTNDSDYDGYEIMDELGKVGIVEASHIDGFAAKLQYASVKWNLLEESDPTAYIIFS